MIATSPAWVPGLFFYSVLYGWTAGFVGSLLDVFEYLADWNQQEANYARKYAFHQMGKGLQNRSRLPLPLAERILTMAISLPLFLMVGALRGLFWGPYRAFKSVQRRAGKWLSRLS